MLTRVAKFAASNVGLFPKTSAALEVQTALESAVRELADLSSARVSAETWIRSSRNERTTARDALKGLLAQANLTARALDSDKFRLPRKPTDRAFIDSGRAFAADIEPLKKDFIRHGLSPDEVTAAAEALDRAILNYAGGRAKRAAAIQEFDATVEAAMGYMRRFEVLVANNLADNTAAIAEWNVARSIDRIAVRKRNVQPPAQPVPLPVAA